MPKSFFRSAVVACLSSVAFIGAANAQTSDDALRRLEAKIDALAKENASLRSRLTRVEGQPRAAMPKQQQGQQQGYVGPIDKPVADPTPQQVNAAREAFAADMPVAVKYAPPPRPACAQFGGFYAGVNGGGNYYTNDWKDRDDFGPVLGITNASDGSNSRGGWNAGGQLGWNYQTGCAVWGVVADIDWADSKIDVDYSSGGALGSGRSLSYSSELKWFGTARTRAGIVVDNLLLYATGGLAYAQFDRSLTYRVPGFLTNVFKDDGARIGFVVGVGTEWNLGNNWTLGSEFLYMGFQRDNVSFACVSCPGISFVPWRFEFNDAVWVTRVNLNYRFGDYGKTPVVAKY